MNIGHKREKELLELRVKDLIALRDEVDHLLKWGKVYEARQLIELDREQNGESEYSD